MVENIFPWRRFVCGHFWRRHAFA